MAHTLPYVNVTSHPRPLHDRIRRQLAGLSTFLSHSDLTDKTDAIMENLKSIASDSKSPSTSGSTTLGRTTSQSQGGRSSDFLVSSSEGPREEVYRKPALDEDDKALYVSMPRAFSNESISQTLIKDFTERAHQIRDLARTGPDKYCTYECVGCPKRWTESSPASVPRK